MILPKEVHSSSLRHHTHPLYFLHSTITARKYHIAAYFLIISFFHIKGRKHLQSYLSNHTMVTTVLSSVCVKVLSTMEYPKKYLLNKY